MNNNIKNDDKKVDQQQQQPKKPDDAGKSAGHSAGHSAGQSGQPGVKKMEPDARQSHGQDFDDEQTNRRVNPNKPIETDRKDAGDSSRPYGK